jgi:cell fate regulator YaaT (PSP1 superfamily)
LNPGKISGLCGRLMCCLSYENDYYADMYKKVPKVGSEVGTPDGKAIVVSVNMLKMEVKTKKDDGNGGWIWKDYKVEDVKFKKSNQPEPDDKDDEE